MKKVLSVFLALAMVVSLFSVIGVVSASAEASDAGEHLTVMDFSEAQRNKISKMYSTISSRLIVDNDNAEQGYIYKFDSLSTTNTSGNNKKWTEIAPVLNSDATDDLYCNAGDVLKISFKIKIVKASKTFRLFAFFAGTDLGIASQNADSIVSSGVQIFEHEAVSNETGYTEYSAYVTAPKDGKLWIAALINDSNPTKQANQDIRIDDITVWDYTDAVGESTFVNFDSESDIATYISNNPTEKFLQQTSMIVEDDDTAHGNVLKFDNIGKYSGTVSNPRRIARITDSLVDVPFTIKAGQQYKMTFDMKKVTATVAFNLILVYTSGTDDITSIKYQLTNNSNSYFYWCAAKSGGSWENYSFTFTAPCNGELAITLASYSGNSAVQDIRLDNIKVQRVVSVTCNYQNGSEPETVEAYCGDAFAPVSPIPAAKTTWWLDDACTIPAPATVSGNCEVWAKYDAVKNDFDENNVYESDSRFVITDYAGTGNSTALCYKVNDGESMNNGYWPARKQLKNPDGSNFRVDPSRKYTVEFDAMIPGYESLSDISGIGITWMGNSYTPETHDFISDTYSGYSYIKLKNWVSTGYTGGWRHVTINILPNSELPEKNAYLMFRYISTSVYIDNIKITDVTAQNNVICDEKVVASGYPTTEYVLPESDGKDFICWSETENGAAVTGGTFNGTDKTVYAIRSNVNTYDAVKGSQKLRFMVHFGNISLTYENDVVAIDCYEKNGKLYDITEIGILAMPDELLNGAELTLDTENAVKGSNSNLKYASASDVNNEMSVYADVDFGAKYTRNYTVVGYIKLINGEVIYGTQRTYISKNFKSAANIEDVDAAALTHGDYKLTWNSEFNGETLDTTKTKNWGGITKLDSVNNYAVMDQYTTYIENGELVQVAEKIDENTAVGSNLITGPNFTHGYVEFRAKYPGDENCSGGFWFNSAGIKDANKVIKPIDENDYINPEIDFIEYCDGSLGCFNITTHNWNALGEQINSQYRVATGVACNFSDYHIFGFERTSDYIRFYIDGVKVAELTKAYAISKINVSGSSFKYYTENQVAAIFDNPIYIRNTVGVNANAEEGTISEVRIDYIRIYE